MLFLWLISYFYPYSSVHISVTEFGQTMFHCAASPFLDFNFCHVGLSKAVLAIVPVGSFSWKDLCLSGGSATQDPVFCSSFWSILTHLPGSQTLRLHLWLWHFWNGYPRCDGIVRPLIPWELQCSARSPQPRSSCHKGPQPVGSGTVPSRRLPLEQLLLPTHLLLFLLCDPLCRHSCKGH